MINFVIAFRDEAQPFIDLLSLALRSNINDFAIFGCADVQLIISGMGIENAAAATRTLCERTPSTSGSWFNFGIAGSADFETGALVMASSVYRQQSGERWNCWRPPSIILPDTVVRTVEEPETHYHQPGVYDMEVAGIFESLAVSNGNTRVTCIKLVTDGPDQPASRLKFNSIREMIARIRPQLAEWFNRGENAL